MTTEQINFDFSGENKKEELEPDTPTAGSTPSQESIPNPTKRI
jgi:hypothetical protein